MNTVAEVAREVKKAEIHKGGENSMKLINEKQAAEMFGCTASTFRKWRLQGKGPAFCRVGRLVRYSESDLLAYLEDNRVEPMTAGGVR